MAQLPFTRHAVFKISNPVLGLALDEELRFVLNCVDIQALTFFFLRKVSALELMQFSHDPQGELAGVRPVRRSSQVGPGSGCGDRSRGLLCHPPGPPPPSVSLRVEG